MQVWTALLRGINVGGHRKIPMAELQGLCTELGWAPVRTYIASGNVVFGSAESPEATKVAGVAQQLTGQLTKQLTTAVAQRFGFEVEVVIRSQEELDGIISAVLVDAVLVDPVLADQVGGGNTEPDTSNLNVAFFTRLPTPDEVQAWTGALTNGASMHLVDSLRVGYVRTPGGLADPFLAGAAAKSFTAASTMRNWRTVMSLQRIGREISAG